MPTTTNAELLQYVEDTFGVRIPQVRCCARHRTPAEAFCDSYFARTPVTVWNASRAFGGKTYLLSLLALTESVTLETSVTVLGGSGEQSVRVLDAMRGHWGAPHAPRHLLDGLPKLNKTRLLWGNTITALTASQTAVRGLHPARLRIDEADEMRLSILEAAQGQPMDQKGVRAQTVIASTHQHPDGTMTEVLRRTAENRDGQCTSGAGRKRWNRTAGSHRHRCSGNAPRSRPRCGARNLTSRSRRPRGAPSTLIPWNGRSMLRSVKATPLRSSMGGRRCRADRRNSPARRRRYAHGADWAQAVDFTVVVTLQCDVKPLQLVAAVRTNRRPWPVMIDLLNSAAGRYPGPVAHDATGGGSVVAEYVKAREVFDFQMTGRQRRDLFISYIAALERHELKMPRLEPFYREHKYCSVDALYGSGHPPDTVVACALAYHAFRTGRAPGDYGITI